MMRLAFAFAFILFFSLPVKAEETLKCSFETLEEHKTLYKHINRFDDVMACLKNEFEAVEQKRIGLEEKRIKDSKMFDIIFVEGRSLDFSEEYKKAQNAFENYRSIECGDTDVFETQEGFKVLSYSVFDMAACPIVLTKQRIQILKNEVLEQKNDTTSDTTK